MPIKDIKADRAPQNINTFGKDAKNNKCQMSEISSQQQMTLDK